MTRTRAMTNLARELTVQLSLASPFQPTVFVSRLAALRGLTIRLVPFPMLGSANGFCLRVGETEYLVFYEPDVSPQTLARILYHEAAHIILGHVPISTPAQIAETLALLNPTPASGPPLFRAPFRRQRYSLPFELDAEALAMALTALSLRASTLALPAAVPHNVADAADDAPSEVGAFYGDLGL